VLFGEGRGGGLGVVLCLIRKKSISRKGKLLFPEQDDLTAWDQPDEKTSSKGKELPRGAITGVQGVSFKRRLRQRTPGEKKPCKRKERSRKYMVRGAVHLETSLTPKARPLSGGSTEWPKFVHIKIRKQYLWPHRTKTPLPKKKKTVNKCRKGCEKSSGRGSTRFGSQTAHL